MEANSKQLSTKSKATTTLMSLRSSQLSIQNAPKTPNETNNNEELVNIIRKFMEELEDHDKFCEILKSHLETANQRLNEISDEVVELIKSLEFTQAEVKEEITNIKDNLNQVKTEIQELGEDVLDPDYVTNKLIELEDRSRRNNIRIDGIEEEQYETWDRCEENLQKVIKDKLGIDDEIEIDRCHSMKKAEKIGQIMKENRVHEQLFVECLDLKISKELSKPRKN